MEFEVLVQLKDDVLDPEARAIRDTLLSQGISGVQSVTVSKRYVVSLTGPSEECQEKIQKIADKYLANPVSQTYSIQRLGR